MSAPESTFNIETTVAMIRKNRGGDVLRVALATVGDSGKIVDVRQLFVPEGSKEYTATKRGFAISVRKLDELISALVAAKRKCVELDWLDAGSGDTEISGSAKKIDTQNRVSSPAVTRRAA